MKPKKEIIERCMALGVMGRLNELLSAAHMLQCVASNLHGEAEDLMQEYASGGIQPRPETKRNMACTWAILSERILPM